MPLISWDYFTAGSVGWVDESGAWGVLLRSCPPAFGLLLDLTAQCTPTTRSGATVGAPGEPTAAQLVGVGVYQSEVKEETEGQGLQLGDMSGGTCPRAPADSAPTLIGVRLS